MEETILKAIPRSGKPKKVRDAGFIPGVLNEADTSSSAVQFETAALNKVISRHGPNAKIWVELGADKHFGFIKEIQRHPVEGKVIHIAVQLVKKNQELKIHLPVTFHGRDDLEHRMLQVHLHKPEIEVMGKASLMPDVAVADLANKVDGDNITVSDFNFPKTIKVLDSEHEIYAVIKARKEEIVEEAEEVKEVKEAV